jgi:predicted small lipoprotein YifL
MKNYLRAMLVVAAVTLIAACSNTTPALPSGPSAIGAASGTASQSSVRQVSGVGEVQQQPGVVHRDTIAGRKEEDGSASGQVTVRLLDLTGFGLDPGHVTVVARITCLEFTDDAVWFGATATSSSDKSLLAPGLEETIGQIKKINGVDYLFSGPAAFYVAPGTKCTDRPALPIQPITSGHFDIR